MSLRPIVPVLALAACCTATSALAAGDPCAGQSGFGVDQCRAIAAQVDSDCAAIGRATARLACWDRIYRLHNCPMQPGQANTDRCRAASPQPVEQVELTSSAADDHWTVRQETSAFGGATNVFLSVASDGPTTCGLRRRASLILRCLDDRTSAYVVHDCATPLIGGEGWAADQKLDNGEIERIRLTPTRGGDGFGYFEYRDARILIEAMEHATAFHLRFQDIEGFESTLHFPVSGLSPHLSILKQACGWSEVAPWSSEQTAPHDG